MKKVSVYILFLGVASFISCQKDIPLLGEDDNGNTLISPKTEVYIRSISLSNFPEYDQNTALRWDSGSVQSFDPMDSIGPEIYYNFYKKSDQGLIMEYKQLSHFSNVLPLNPDSPLVYFFTEPYQIFPEYIDSTFYLRIYDLDYADPVNDSTLMDSIPFTIGPDNSLADPYIISASGIGFNGSKVTLGLEWK